MRSFSLNIHITSRHCEPPLLGGEAISLSAWNCQYCWGLLRREDHPSRNDGCVLLVLKQEQYA